MFVVADYRDRLLRSPDSLKSATAKPSLSPPPAPARPNSAGSNNSGSHLLLDRPPCSLSLRAIAVVVCCSRAELAAQQPERPLAVTSAVRRRSRLPREHLLPAAATCLRRASAEQAQALPHHAHPVRERRVGADRRARARPRPRRRRESTFISSFKTPWPPRLVSRLQSCG